MYSIFSNIYRICPSSAFSSLSVQSIKEEEEIKADNISIPVASRWRYGYYRKESGRWVYDEYVCTRMHAWLRSFVGMAKSTHVLVKMRIKV